MARKEDLKLMYRIACRYYLDQVQQVEIARLEGVSRSTVSRMLEKARAGGMVRVEVNMPVELDVSKLERELAKALGLRRAVVAPVSESVNDAAHEERIMLQTAAIAGAYLPRLLQGSRYVGLGWGRTLYEAADRLPEVKEGEPKFFVPMVNNYSRHCRYMQTSTIVSRFCDKFDSEGFYLNISDPSHKRGERNESELENIRQLCVYWDMLDAAVLSFSSPRQLLTNPYYIDVWQGGIDIGDPDEKEMLFESMGQVFYANGSYYGVNRNFDMISMDLQRLKEIDNVICLGAGIGKAETLIAAGRGGFYKTLVVDHLTAEAMLKMLK